MHSAGIDPAIVRDLKGKLPQIQSLTVPNPYVALRTAKGESNPSFSKSGLCAWKIDGLHDRSTPVTAKLGSPVEISASFKVHPDALGHAGGGWGITGKAASNPRISVSFDDLGAHDELGPDPKISSVRGVLRFDGASDVPWGFQGDILWTATILWSATTLEYPDYATTPLELYAVSPSLPRLYISSGIPLELLRLFVAPACEDQTVHDLDDWVAWAVKRCHASTADHDTKNPVDTQDRIHSFRYDVVNLSAPNVTLRLCLLDIFGSGMDSRFTLREQMANPSTWITG